MKPKLVLHVCCAPDEAYVLYLLRNTHELRCFFSNPNIYPAGEYELRMKEARKVARQYDTPFSAPVYEPMLWDEAIAGLEHTPEGGTRCRACFLLRFRQTAQFCKDIGCPAFTSVMSISPHKNIHMLNETGRIAAQEFDVAYEEFNFKKQDGFKKSIDLSKQLGLYRQDYCGCRLSLEERDERNREKNDAETGSTK